MRARRSVRQLVALAALGATLYWAWRTGGKVVLLAADVSILATYAIQAALHEFGHLGAALLLRLPVSGVRIFGVSFGARMSLPFKNVVVVKPQATAPALGTRMTLLAAAGPSVNLAIAALLLPLATSGTLAKPWVGAAIGALAVAGYMGIANLLPVLTVHGTNSDGMNIWRWLTATAAQRERVARREAVAQAKADGASPEVGPSTGAGSRGDIDKWAVLVDGDDPVAGAATIRLLRAIEAAAPAEKTRLLAEHAPRLARLVIDRGAATLAPAVGLFLLFEFLRRNGLPPEVRTEVISLADLALVGETALATAPESPNARTTLAMVRVLQHRPQDARQLLLVAFATRIERVYHARGDVIRALAELELGDASQARRLVNRAMATSPADPMTHLLLCQLLLVVQCDRWQTADSVVAAAMRALMEHPPAAQPGRDGVPGAIRAALLAQYAWIATVLGAADLRGEALAACDELLAVHSDQPNVMHTRAQLEIDEGKAAQGFATCASLLDTQPFPASSRAEVLASMSMAAESLGRVADARQYRAEAEQLFPSAQLLW